MVYLPSRKVPRLCTGWYSPLLFTAAIAGGRLKIEFVADVECQCLRVITWRDWMNAVRNMGNQCLETGVLYGDFGTWRLISNWTTAGCKPGS